MNSLTPDYRRERFKQRSEIHQRDTRQKSELAFAQVRARDWAKGFCLPLG